jgi:hypothetical protein
MVNRGLFSRVSAQLDAWRKNLKKVLKQARRSGWVAVLKATPQEGRFLPPFHKNMDVYGFRARQFLLSL